MEKVLLGRGKLCAKVLRQGRGWCSGGTTTTGGTQRVRGTEDIGGCVKRSGQDHENP